MKIASGAGLAVISPSTFAAPGFAADRSDQFAESYAGTLFLCFNASGGWDPTHLCDAKTNPITNLKPEEVETEAGLTYPAYFDPEIYGEGTGAFIPEFFRKHAGRLRVINGIDMQTNGHDSGSRHVWSGRLSDGAPTLAAYMAATFDPTLPMAFLTFGGFSDTEGIAAQTRAGNVSALTRVAYPQRIDPNNAESGFHSPRAYELIQEAQRARDLALLAGQKLPRINHSVSALYAARSGSNELRLLQEYLPESFSDNGLQRSVQLALAAYQAGITISVNLNLGGFDTHGNHDRSHVPRLNELLQGIDFAWEEATARGVADRVVIVVGSEFGRTPGYNDGNGKDHWSVSSMMLMGQGIPPGVVGATTPEHRAIGVTSSLDLDPNGTLKILPGHVHRALRDRFAFGDDNDLASLFPLNVDRLPVLG